MKEKSDIVLQCLIDEYGREREVNGLLESKASYYVAIIIGIIMISFSVTPYKNLFTLIKSGTTSGWGKAITAFIFIGAMITLLVLSFYHFMKVLSLKKHAAINVEFITEKTLSMEGNAMREKIIDHYLRVAKEENRINKSSAKHIKEAINLFYIGLGLMFVITVALIVW